MKYDPDIKVVRENDEGENRYVLRKNEYRLFFIYTAATGRKYASEWWGETSAQASTVAHVVDRNVRLGHMFWARDQDEAATIVLLKYG